MRQRTINVWPGMADLMTALAVIGIAGTLTSELELQQCRAQIQVNERLRAAVEEAESLMQKIAIRAVDPTSGRRLATVAEDQTIVTFERNSSEVRRPLHSDAEGIIDAVCRVLSAEESARNVLVVVEGHTDSSRCSNDPHCNLRISAARATEFTALLQDTCRDAGATGIRYLAVGMGDSRLRSQDKYGSENRRIEMRLRPDYERLVATPR
jgi:flagellar motor protein MotB